MKVFPTGALPSGHISYRQTEIRIIIAKKSLKLPECKQEFRPATAIPFVQHQ